MIEGYKMFFYNQNFDKPKEYLDHYLYHYGKFRVQKFMKDIPQRWQLYGTPNSDDFLRKYKFYNAREIFPDEIVIDIDADKEMSKDAKKKDALAFTRVVSGRLKRINAYFAAWDSGGDGYHIHLLYPEIRELAKTDLEVAWFKESILKYLVEGINTEGLYSKVCHVKKTLISLELSEHRKGNGFKHIHEYYCPPSHNGQNLIPKPILDRYEEIKSKKVLKAFRKYEDANSEVFDYKDEQIPDCINFFLNREINDGRHRMLFILVNFFKSKKTKPELYEFIEKWNRYLHNGHLTADEISKQIEYHYDKKGRPGPRYIKSLLDDIGYKYVYEKCPHCKEANVTGL